MIGFRITAPNKKAISSKASLILFLVPVISILIYATTKEYILPLRFFYDEGTIFLYMLDGATFTLGDSYKSTAGFFNLFNLSRGSHVLSVASTIAIYFSLSLHIRKSKSKSIDYIEYMLFVFIFFLMSTYLTMLSKELIVFLLMFPFLFFAGKGYLGLVVWTLIALAYAAYFRTYWILIIGFFWAILIVLRFGKKYILLFALVPALLFALSFIFYLSFGVDLDHFRTTVNDYRLESLDQDARTIILPFISGEGPVISWVNSLITWLLLMFPIPLLLMMTPYYVVNAILISFLFSKTLKAISSQYKIKHGLELSATAAIIMAFTSVQAIFEPDYGSFIKHLTPLYPLFFYLILSSRTFRGGKLT